MKKIYVLIVFLFSSYEMVKAQAILTNSIPSITIDFSNTMQTSMGSNPSTAYACAGFEPDPITAGRLNSNAWASTGMSFGSLVFAGTRITDDYARGAVNAAQTTGGFYAYTGAPNSVTNPALMIQPSGSDFAPGTLTLRIQNNGTLTITQLDVSYNIYVRNDEDRSSSFNFSYSSDNASYTDVNALNYTSTQAKDVTPTWVLVPGSPSRSTSITGINVAPGAYFYIRWSSNDVSGSGSRDELGLDDINLTATYDTPIFTWTGTTNCTWVENNWTPSSLYPGSSSVTGNIDIARFDATHAATAGIGINMNTFNGSLYIGGIEIASLYTGPAFNIGNNSTSKNGILYLNGSIINSVPNTVIRNASGYDFTINDKPIGDCTSGNKTMGVNLKNSTNNIVSVEGTGNVIINSIISGSNPLEKTGSGAGKLTLNAANTYSGNVTISAGTVQLLNNSTLALANSITVKNGGNLQISNSQSLANVTLEAGSILTVDATRTLNITGTLTVDVDAIISTTGTISYAGAAALVYNGTGSRTTGIEWTSSTVNSVTIDNNAIVKVNSNRDVPATLFLINGILDADTYSFSSTGITFTINGTVRTANLNGLINSGASGTTFTGYTNGATFSSTVLGTTSTIDFNASSGTQNITTAVDYYNLIASGGGTKVPGSLTATDVSVSISVLDDGTVLNVGNNSFGNTGTNFTMTGTSKYINGGNSTKPDASGTYSLSAASTIEFMGTSATILRVGVPTTNYGYIIVSGSNVSLSSPTASIKMQSGTTFTVTGTGIFNVENDIGFTGGAVTAVSSTNNPTIVLQAGSTINYNGLAQPLTPRNDYKNLTISGTGAKTASGVFTVAETFTRSGDASLATTSPTYGSNATLAYVDATAGRTYTAGLEWPVTNGPTNLVVNLSGTGPTYAALSADRTVPGSITLTAGELSINGNTLTANGAFSYGTGTLTGSSTSNLTLGGAAGILNFTTGAASRSLNNLTLENSGTAKIGSAMDIYGNINVKNTAAGAMNFNVQNVTLKSNATNTATIDKLNTSGTNLINATNVTMERWIPMTNPGFGTGRRYQLLTPTVTTTTSIRANWMEGGQVTSAGGYNDPNPDYGTHITGGSVANGFDQTQTNQPSLFTTSNGTTPVYTAFTNTTGILNALTGYFLFVRGGRDVSMSLYNTNQAANGWVNLASSNTTLKAKGTIKTGPVSAFTNAFNSTANAWNLITNPYPAPIDWSQVNRTNVNAYYTYWDPHILNRGAFVNVDNTGLATPTPPAGQLGGARRYIQPGQAFFVIATGGGTPTINMEEADKAVGNNNNPVFLIPPKNFSASLFYYEGGINRRLADGVRAIFDNAYSPTFNGTEDAVDLPNWDENMAIPRDGYNLVVDKRPEIVSRDTMPLLINNLHVANYELEFTGQSFLNDNITPILIDNFTGNRTGLSISGTTVVPITVSSNPASAASNRFYVVFENTAGPLPIDISSIKAYEKNSGIQVDWVMNSEQDMDKYEVEKSTDGRHFVKTGTVLSKGNSNIQVNYGWFDANPAFGDNFYRIKSFEKSGTNKYSDIVRVNIGKGISTGISMYPNPFEGNGFNLQLNKFAAGTYTLTMYNSLGQQVYNTTLTHGGGSATQFISLGKELVAGTYTIKINGEGTTLTRTITKK